MPAVEESKMTETMWMESSNHIVDLPRVAEIACHLCRRRKVKCDRKLPHCQVCVHTGQTCEYPLRPKKPGPKIGSLQRQKRRYRDRDAQPREGRPEKRASRSPADSHSESEARYINTSPEKSLNDDELYAACNKEDASPTATVCDEWTQRRLNSHLNINDLSFILHPSHEASTPERDPPQSTASTGVDDPNSQGLVLQQACYALGISEETLRKSLQNYFNNMVAINLFHQPSFNEKIATISSTVQLFALLTAMIGYAAHFQNSAPTSEDIAPDSAEPNDATRQSPEHFLGLARKLIERALEECGDEPPTLCILQASIITTHWELTRGVHGRAWRSLGMCVRLAYEMNMHLVDAKGTFPAGQEDPLLWRDAEERRRAWWAVWEMDVFASTIRRTPTAIDWTQMETLLPVDDCDWFNNRPVVSAYMECDPGYRWKSLQESGNQSAKAWFLVINSIMKDAQIISSPRGVPFQSEHNQQYQRRTNNASRKSREPQQCPVERARQKLEILANSVQCFVISLPSHLHYRNQYLSFEGPVPGRLGPSLRQQHCGIHNIFVMTQLARLMIHRYELFGSHTHHHQLATGPQQQRHLENSSNGQLRSQTVASGAPSVAPALAQKPMASTSLSEAALHDLNSPAVGQYFEAADNILTIVNRSCQDHIQHINPFLLSTIWLAAAVQLVRKHIGWPTAHPVLIKSRFDVLYLTYKRCAKFWNSRTAMEQNLESLELQLEGHNDADGASLANHKAVDKTSKFTAEPSPAAAAATEHANGYGSSTKSSLPGMSEPSRDDRRETPSDGQRIDSALGGVQNALPPVSSRNDPSRSSTRLLPDTPPFSIMAEDGTTSSTISGEVQSTSLSALGKKCRPTTGSSLNYFRFETANLHGPGNGGKNDNNSSHIGADGHSEIDDTTNDARSLLDFMHLSPTRDNRGSQLLSPPPAEPNSEMALSMFSPAMYDSGLDMGDTQPQNVDWRSLDLPIDIHDLLSGFSSY